MMVKWTPVTNTIEQQKKNLNKFNQKAITI